MAKHVCPRCGSTDISGVGLGTALGMGEQKCAACGYRAPQFPVTEATEEELREQQEAMADADIEEELDELEVPFNRLRFYTGVIMIALGIGSVPMIRTTLTGLWGALLIPIGLLTCYREWERR